MDKRKCYRGLAYVWCLLSAGYGVSAIEHQKEIEQLEGYRDAAVGQEPQDAITTQIEDLQGDRNKYVLIGLAQLSIAAAFATMSSQNNKLEVQEF